MPVLKYHTCGEKIWVGYYWNSIRHYERYYDKMMCADGVTHCPKCGEWLTSDVLLDAPPDVTERDFGNNC